ncbi:MAG TPA: hypothetical protein DDZ41_00380, partial [Flavobacterium sp.]|nr:hypothetical protein [Flavobacterium sp.]
FFFEYRYPFQRLVEKAGNPTIARIIPCGNFLKWPVCLFYGGLQNNKLQRLCVNIAVPMVVWK